jgi:DNA-binding transcriptional LysR family regulator
MLSHMPFTLRQLDVFASLCATRSFRRSSEALGISQAAVSNQLKALERQLGIALFDRPPGRRPVLTDHGAAFEIDLRTFRSSAEALARHRRIVAEQSLAPVVLRVLVGQGLMDNYIRRRLGPFLAAHPLVELIFETRAPQTELARDLDSGRFDFALIHRRADVPVEPYMRSLALVRGGIYGHRSFAEGKELPLSSQQVNTLPFIMPNAAIGPERDMLAYFEQGGIRPQRVVGHTQYYDVMATMLESGIGVASFADAILPPAMRASVVMLHPLENWRLLWFRRDAGEDARYDRVEEFLWSCVLNNPDYLRIENCE